MKTITGYHFTGDRLRNGEEIPAVGVWLRRKGKVSARENGLRCSKEPFDALRYASGSILHRVELRGELVSHGSPADKWVGREWRILAGIDATELLGVFARSQARGVLHLWDDAPAVARDYLETGAEDLRLATWAAAVTTEGVKGSVAAWDAALVAGNAWEDALAASVAAEAAAAVATAEEAEWEVTCATTWAKTCATAWAKISASLVRTERVREERAAWVAAWKTAAISAAAASAAAAAAAASTVTSAMSMAWLAASASMISVRATGAAAAFASVAAVEAQSRSATSVQSARSARRGATAAFDKAAGAARARAEQEFRRLVEEEFGKACPKRAQEYQLAGNLRSHRRQSRPVAMP